MKILLMLSLVFVLYFVIGFMIALVNYPEVGKTDEELKEETLRFYYIFFLWPIYLSINIIKGISLL